MLCVPTYISPSPIHGTGLFSNGFIPQGEVIWSFDAGIDHKIKKSEAAMLHIKKQDVLYNHCYINKDNPDVLVLCMDNARFMNFSSDPNTKMGHPVFHGEQSLIAARDILRGEELTVPIESDFDAERKLHES